MKRANLLRCMALLAAAGLTTGRLSAADKPVVTVFAAASLKEAFDAAGPAVPKVTGYPVRLSYGGSDTLAAQLLQGAPADVFASANQPQMQRAIDGGVIPAARVFAHNRLVVIVPV